MPTASQNPSAGATPHPEVLTDKNLTSWLLIRLGLQHRVALLHGDFLCKVVDLDEGDVLYPADPEGEAKTAFKRLVRRKLLVHLQLPAQALIDARFSDPSWIYSALSADDLNGLLSTRAGLLGRAKGRGDEIDDKTAQRVWADAGGRCMFEGCGDDLTEVPLWTKAARVGYLAHIIASDPKGPRGDPVDSHRLSNDPENIMLMCDAHHRLIDSLAPGNYPASVLHKMRQDHKNMVRRYLDSLAFPRSYAVTLHANLANVPTYFHDSDFIEAILASRKAMAPGVLHYIRRTSQRDDRNSPGFWNAYLHEHENEIRRLVTTFNSAPSGITENFSVFPLHHITTMALAGRIMGEAQGIQVFQYNRDRRAWAWDSGAMPLADDTIAVSALPASRSQEVLITIELTAPIDEDALPDDLKKQIDAGVLPWIRLTTPSPRHDCIAHLKDLDQFAQVARRTINHVQDIMRVQRVHLIAVSPACTIFRFGQMLQAGHHPEYVVYDRAGRDFPFAPALSITGHAVSALDGTQNVTISLR